MSNHAYETTGSGRGFAGLLSVFWPLRGILVCGECGRVMSPSVSGYKNFRYRYYRRRSRAFGRPPGKEAGVSACEIEELVRTTLSSDGCDLADPAATLPMREFAMVWRRLEERRQMAALASVLKAVRFDPQGGTISVTLWDDALERVRRK